MAKPWRPLPAFDYARLPGHFAFLSRLDAQAAADMQFYTPESAFPLPLGQFDREASSMINGLVRMPIYRERLLLGQHDDSRQLRRRKRCRAEASHRRSRARLPCQAPPAPICCFAELR